MTERDRFNILENEKINPNVLLYLKSILQNLNVEILGRESGPFMKLSNRGKLEGWCWQSTESAALFMPDDTIVYRGNLKFEEYKTYYHSFIVFSFMGKEYVFDPCLVLINSSELYFKIFEVEVKGKVTAKDIKEYFIQYYNNPPKREYPNKKTEELMNKLFKDVFGDVEREPEVVIHDKEDPNAPMYRNGSGYKRVEFDKDKILSLTVHYYMNA